MTLLPPSLASSRMLRKNRVMKTALANWKTLCREKTIRLREPVVPRRLWKSVVKDMQFLEAAG